MLLQHWGYYYSALTPAAVVNSGDTIVVETSTQHGGDDYDKLVRGDPGMEVGGPEASNCAVLLGAFIFFASHPLFCCAGRLQVDAAGVERPFPWALRCAHLSHLEDAFCLLVQTDSVKHFSESLHGATRECPHHVGGLARPWRWRARPDRAHLHVWRRARRCLAGLVVSSPALMKIPCAAMKTPRSPPCTVSHGSVFLCCGASVGRHPEPGATHQPEHRQDIRQQRCRLLVCTTHHVNCPCAAPMPLEGYEMRL